MDAKDRACLSLAHLIDAAAYTGEVSRDACAAARRIRTEARRAREESVRMRAERLETAMRRAA